MFRQVVLSTTKSKLPAPPSYNTNTMVHKEGTSAKSYVDETEMLFDKNSWKPKKSFSRSISLELVKQESPQKRWKDIILGSTRRPQSAKVTSTYERQKEANIPTPVATGAATVDDNGRTGLVPVAITIGSRNEDLLDAELTKSNDVKERLHHLAHAFSTRGQRVKKKIIEPASRTPSPSPEPPRLRLDSLIYEDDGRLTKCSSKDGLVRRILSGGGVFDPQTYFYITWLFLVCLSFLYNSWAIFLRSVFPYQTEDNLNKFLIVDYILDGVYLVDIIVFKSRVCFIEDGQLIEDATLSRKHYMKSLDFKLDCLSLFPLDILYLRFGPKSLLRFPRMFKITSFWEFFNRIDAMAKSPYIIRILRTLIYMMYLVHLNACAYYAMSEYEGLGSNEWVYNNEGNAYLRCFYFAIRTATSISGKMPKPLNTYEFIFMTVSWLLGVFVFAFLIGQIRDIVATATQNKAMYRQIMDQSIRYSKNLNLPERLQLRIRKWLNYTWEQQKTFDESKILNLLPSKMKTDLALSVHYQMLNKVQLFQECEPTVIRDLVVKLKPVLFLPGDYICRKGEIGTEMYIVNKGKVVVTEGSTVLVTLSEGSVLGEISVLGIPGCSRRNADVRSLGYSNLYVLSKADLWDTLRNYPEAQSILRHKAKKVMRDRLLKEREGQEAEEDSESEVIIKDRPETPLLLRTVMKMMPQDSKFMQRVSRSSSNATLTPSMNSDATSFDGSIYSVNAYQDDQHVTSLMDNLQHVEIINGIVVSDQNNHKVSANSAVAPVVVHDDFIHANLIDDIINASNSVVKY